MNKVCTECKVQFSTPSGNKYTCSKKCYKAHKTRVYYSPEKIALRKGFRFNSGRYSTLKGRVKAKGFSYVMSKEEYFKIVSEDCYYCGFKHHGIEKGVGLDRLDNNKEYLESNVVSCCGKCNRSRSNVHTPEKFKQMMNSDKYIEALEKLNSLQPVERTLDEFIDFIIAKY